MSTRLNGSFETIPFAHHYGYDYLFRHHRCQVQWRRVQSRKANKRGTGLRRWWHMERHQRARWTRYQPAVTGWRWLQDRPTCFQPEFVARYPQHEVCTDITAPTVRQALLQSLLNSHLQWQLMGWAAEGAKNGIDYRYPLLDRRLIEFALGLPATVLGRKGWDRYLFRYTMRDRLPAELCWRKGNPDPAVNVERHRINKDWDRLRTGHLTKIWIDNFAWNGSAIPSLPRRIEGSHIRLKIVNSISSA